MYKKTTCHNDLHKYTVKLGIENVHLMGLKVTQH